METNVRYLSRDLSLDEGQAVRLHFAQGVNEVHVPSIIIGQAQIDHADALHRYGHWQRPTMIVSDGAYGVAGFPGDPPHVDGLAEWYAPHVAAWSYFALPETTLWFWSTEVGWATVHPLLKLHGWDYRALHVWDKGIAHIAGNVNSKTIRRFPVVTEVCVQYTRAIKLQTGDGRLLPMQQWLREEWLRSGLPLSKTNEACGVKNAATRKYFTQDHLWYFPPPEMMERLAQFANTYGLPSASPYFSLDGERNLTAEMWSHMRAKWNHVHGISNVWTEPAVRGMERLKDERAKNLHTNQKPLKLIERIILASSDPGDVVWGPFGGLCTTAIAAMRNKRRCYSADEAQVVDGLNELRGVWDPANRYTQYRFIRQSQQFPDVVLRNAVVPSDIILGIGLKGWYALAKEGEPSFRYRVTPNVCAPQDLLVVYPWALSRVVSGAPMLFFPYVESARYAAEYRYYYWHTRKGVGDKSIRLSTVNHFYPTKSEPISDVPKSDSEGNFGRFARTGLMGEYIEQLFREELSGIPLRAWQRFFAIFDEKITEGEIARKLEQIARTFNQGGETVFSTELEYRIQTLVSLLREP